MQQVSIVLPTHNKASYLHHTVESIRAQTFQDWELIVVDDCSTDETPQEVESFGQSDPRIRTVRNHTPMRTAESLNIGFAHSRGELLTWTNDDSLYRPHAFDVLVKMIGSADFVYSEMTLIDEVGQDVGHVPAHPPEHILLENFLAGCFLYRRSVMEKVGSYDPMWVSAEAWDFFIRAIKKGVRFKAIPDDLYELRVPSGFTGGQKRKEIEDQVEGLLRRYKGTLPEPHNTACLLHLAQFEWKHGHSKDAKRLAHEAMGMTALKHYRQELLDAEFGPGTSKKWTKE